MRVFVALTLSIAVATRADARELASRYPLRAVSPSGEWVLTVDATNRRGWGPGSCRMERNGDLAWEAQLSFTFTEVAVTDDGVTAGYASKGGERWRESVLAVIGEDGAFRLRDVLELGIPMGCFTMRDPDPYRVLLDPANDRVLFRRSSNWFIHRLSDGARTMERDPIAIVPPGFEDDELEDRGWRVVPDTDLVLADWSCEASPRHSAFFALVDGNLRVVWSWSLLEARKQLTEQDRQLKYELGVVHTQIVEGGRGGAFTVAVVETGEKVALRAARDSQSPSGWRVDEIGREALEVAPARDWDAQREWLEELPVITLDLLEHVPRRSGVEWDQAGPVLASRLPTEPRVSGTERWFFQTDAPRRWVAVQDELHWIDDVTGERRKYERGPDGRWLGFFSYNDLELAPDGSLAVRSYTLDELGLERHCIHLFDADGTPRRTVLLDPRGFSPHSFLYTGSHLLCPGEKGEWIVLDLEGTPLARYVLSTVPGVLEDYGLYDSFVAYGRELWVVARLKRELWRFALP